MSLRVRCVGSVDDIVEPVVGYLTAGAATEDLFHTQHLIVPTAGVRAWLAPQVAARLGSTPGHADGVMANVRVGYVGMLNGLLRAGVEDEDDAWSIERVTMAVLRVIHDLPKDDPLVRKHGGHLRAARAIADRFDRYAARRPSLIRSWEEARRTNAEVGRDNAQMEWQYALWRSVRDVIDVPSWPARTQELCARLIAGQGMPGLPPRLMVAGVETLSVANLEILRALGNVIDVEVICVQPSAHLWGEWSSLAATLPVTPGVAPARGDDAHVVPGCDVLVTTWLRGAFEMQMLLASQGIGVEAPTGAVRPASGQLLHRMQAAIADPHRVAPAPLAPGDVSVQIHRAHNLARQAEVLRDALLHAFHDLPDLRPHEVIVLCADIEQAAPMLKATFDQPMKLHDGRHVTIPFVVADRSLRDVSPGADLLAAVLGLAGSRFDVASVMRIATDSLVLRERRIGQEEIDVWVRLVETTRVRWGLDAGQRAEAGFGITDITAHTWKEMLDRALLGALLPDAETPVREIGGVVPLTHVDTAEIDAITAFGEILGVLAELENKARHAQPVGVWCNQVEEMLVQLCGPSCTDIDDALAVIQVFRDSTMLHRDAGTTQVLEAVEFAEFADLLGQRLSATPGRQPLRTGAVTATSFVPLRSVPYRVVCVVGLDDGTLAVGEAEGDDIVANDPLMGDPDPRVDSRRMLLEAVLAAGERLVITCNGRSIKNNSPVPLVTPLAELLDFCARLGVDVPDSPDKHSAIEHLHPRHASGALNFVTTDGPVNGIRWSHDSAALAASLGLLADGSDPVPSASVADPYPEVPLRNLEAMFIDPLVYYLRETLHIHTERDTPDPGATLPVDIDEFVLANLAESLVEAAGAEALENSRADWEAAAAGSDTLPVPPFAEEALEVAFAVASAVRGRASLMGIPLTAPDPVEFKVRGDDGTVIDCHVPNVAEDASSGIVFSLLYHTKAEKEITRLAMRLLALRAAGRRVAQAIVIHRDTQNKTLGYLANVITLDTSIDQQEAARRLLGLARVEPVARVTPCADFGDTADGIVAAGTVDDDTVMDAFDDFVEGRGFATSAEAIVFGAAPLIERVYPEDNPGIIDFLTVRGEALVIEKDGGKGNGLQEWVVR